MFRRAGVRGPRPQRLQPIVEVDGGEATGEWYYTVVYTLSNGNLEYGHGKFVRTDAGWKIESVTGRRRITREVHAEPMA